MQSQFINENSEDTVSRAESSRNRALIKVVTSGGSTGAGGGETPVPNQRKIGR